jgi:hypothetical protein
MFIDSSTCTCPDFPLSVLRTFSAFTCVSRSSPRRGEEREDAGEVPFELQRDRPLGVQVCPLGTPGSTVTFRKFAWWLTSVMSLMNGPSSGWRGSCLSKLLQTRLHPVHFAHDRGQDLDVAQVVVELRRCSSVWRRRSSQLLAAGR